MTYRHLKAPNFARKDAVGNLQTLVCPICGTVIADTIDRVLRYELARDGERVKVVRQQFSYLPNYAEIRIAFDDGSFHVTNGCGRCLSSSLPTGVLDELHRADQEDSPDGYTERDRARKAIAATRVKL